jgi:hypothetical protein
MTSHSSIVVAATPDDSVLEWLLDSDPAIRWQVMRDLTHEPAHIVAAERFRIATEGWGAELLASQNAAGHWGPENDFMAWMRLLDILILLRDFGIDPQDHRVQQAIHRIVEKVVYTPLDNRPFFDGETEPCINGRTLTVGVYFGQSPDQVLERLLGEQLDDGGWNCDAPPSVRSSFHTTICVLEGLLEFEQHHGPDPTVTAARLRGQEYLLQRHMFRSLSTGEMIDEQWTRFTFPRLWHYDILRGLDYLRLAGLDPSDDRISEAIETIAQQREPDGRWTLSIPNPERVPFTMEPGEGQESRWITLRALRVLQWYLA